MALVKSRPLTPGQRFLTRNKVEVSKKKPERKLTVFKHNKKGRNCYGRITSRRRGGGHKRIYRIIDFRRDKIDIPAKVQAIEYDPNRSANIALLAYIGSARCESGRQIIKCKYPRRIRTWLQHAFGGNPTCD